MIKGIQKTSLIDFSPYTSAVLFLGGCNFRCPYCHNPELVKGSLKDIDESEILRFLISRKKWIDGVVITGGEPTLHSELERFISKIKKMGLLVKLDTNGTNPLMVDKLIKEGLIDYIAMDIKGPLEKYDSICGVKVDKGKIKDTVYLLMKGIVDYEFRCTAVPGLIDADDIVEIGKWLDGSEKFVIQQFSNSNVLDPKFKEVKPFPPSKLKEFKKLSLPYFKKVEVRGV